MRGSFKMLRRQEFQVWSLCPAELGWRDEWVAAAMVTLVWGPPAPRGQLLQPWSLPPWTFHPF